MRALAITLATIVAPWLVWLPLEYELAILFGAIAIVGACHGFGRVVARLTGHDDADAALAVQWGIAVVIGVGGLQIAAGVYDARVLLVAGAFAHTVDALLAFRARRAAWEERFGYALYSALPALLLCSLAIIHVLAGAGAIGRPFDDDANVIAQLARLSDTGALGDAIGYPRVMQLGGRMAVDGLITAFADPRALRMIEGLAFVLVLWLAVARIRPRDATSAIWATLVVVTGSALALIWPERLPVVLCTGLFTAAIFTIREARPDARSYVPLALLAAALAVVRLELAAPAITLLAAAWWLGRRPLRADWRRLALLAGIFVIVVGAYVLARELAWSDVDAARALVEPRRGNLAVRLGLSIAIAAAIVPALLLLLPRIDPDAGTRALRWLAFAAAAGVGTVAGKLAAERIVGARSLWVLAIAGAIVLVTEVARRRELDRFAFLLVLVLGIVGWEARSEVGRRNWATRYANLMLDVEYARHGAAAAPDYAHVLAAVPAGDRVAVWVSRPERLDYARHDIVDLRTPRVGKLSSARRTELLRISGARWLLVGAGAELLDVAQHRVIAEQPGVTLIELGR